MQKVAKLWVNHQSMTGDPSAHVSYLTNGHQLSVDEQARVWAKSLPKACKADRAALVKHWRGLHDRFVEARQMPGSGVHHNSRVTARQFVINLPNNISDELVNKLAKAVLKDFPRHIPVSMVLHRTSNRGRPHMHLQGLFSYRNGGYGSIQEDFRMNITKQMKQTVANEFRRFGYHVDYGKSGSINNKQRKWLNHQASVEQRRNPREMESIAARSTSKRLRAYCLKQADKMRLRMKSGTPQNDVLPLLSAMVNLPSITSRINDIHAQQTATDTLRTERVPLTNDVLQKKLLKAKRWNQHFKTASMSI